MNLTEEERIMVDVMISARKLQEFLWDEKNKKAGLEEFKRMLRKRVAKIEEISTDNPYYKIELKKRLLQTACICINILQQISTRDLVEGIGIKVSNLPQYSNPVESTGSKEEEIKVGTIVVAKDRICWEGYGTIFDKGHEAYIYDYFRSETTKGVRLKKANGALYYFRFKDIKNLFDILPEESTDEHDILHKDKGGHDYPEDAQTSDCAFGCGCWMGGFNSGGPDGIDPFGKCPENHTMEVENCPKCDGHMTLRLLPGTPICFDCGYEPEEGDE